MRTIVDIPEHERKALEALARRKGISRAEAVRRAIALYLAQEDIEPVTPFGLWRDRGEDGLEWSTSAACVMSGRRSEAAGYQYPD